MQLSFFVIIGALIFYLNVKQSDPSFVPDLTKIHKNDVLPGTQKATLILSDEKKVTLDKGKQSIVAYNDVTIISNNGEISYSHPGTKVFTAIPYFSSAKSRNLFIIQQYCFKFGNSYQIFYYKSANARNR